jgi:aerobic carbon-monoxide dehydrogenase large subunit
MTTTAEPTTPTSEVGRARVRKEDARLITGRTRWTDNIVLPGMVHLTMVRSQISHGRITGIDVEAARTMPGVIAVYTGADFDAEQGGIPCAWPINADAEQPRHVSIATDKVNFAGEIVAIVVARSAAEAKDATEAVEVDIDPLDPVLDMHDALTDGNVIHESLGTNKWVTFPFDSVDAGSTSGQRADDVIAAAQNDPDSVVVTRTWRQQRLIPAFMEPRSTVVDPNGEQLTMWSSTQIPHVLRTMLCVVLGLPEHKLRVIAPDVGGGFGGKLQLIPEEILTLLVARKLGKPAKWTETRSESLVSAHHGRDQLQTITLAAKKDGSFTALKFDITADMGAYFGLFTAAIPVFGAFIAPAVYKIPAYTWVSTDVFTNKTPTDAYRGAGRPESAFAIERMMDLLAAEIGISPVEVRRKNFYEPFDEPTTTPAGIQYDSMNMQPALDRAIELAGYEELLAEQQRRRENNDPVQLGIGFSTYTEICGLAPTQISTNVFGGPGLWEMATVRMLPTGKAEVVTGTTPHGQGHATSWSQIAADALGVTPDDVEVIYGDTDSAPFGRDTYGSRSLNVGGVAVHVAAQKVVDKAKKIAAHMLEASEDDIEFEGGRFSVAGSPDQNVTMTEVCDAAYMGHQLPEGMEPGLTADYFHNPSNFTFPFGAHICVVEVDTETGKVTVQKYVAVDDCGPVINPTIVDGQVHGGIAQGLAQALYEEAIYDEDGNLVTGSMVDYMIPGAPEIPNFILDRTVTPSPSNPLGVKGIGEAGTIGSSQAAINAVVDALSHLGIKHIDMPASPMRVWTAIQEARGGVS